MSETTLALPSCDPLPHRAPVPPDECGARAVEIAAMLGDSVVSVKHCIDPRSGAVTVTTWGLAAASAACLLAAALAFAASVRTAADNARARDTWTRLEHKPGRAFRPHALGWTGDGIAFGGLALGWVGAALTLIRMRSERTSPYYRIGTAPGVELAIEGAPLPAFPLVAPSGDGFVLNVGAGIDGELLADGVAMPLAELAAAGRARPSSRVAGAIEVPIGPTTRIRARAGQTTFVVSAVARPRRHAVPLLARLEPRTLSYLAVSLAAHLAGWGLLQLVPPDAASINLDLQAIEELRIRASLTSRLDPIPDDGAGDASGEDEGAGGLPAMGLPPGAVGNPEASTSGGRLRIARTDDPPQLTRDAAIRVALRAGILGSDQVLVGVQTLAAPSDLLSGFDDTTALGGPLGPDGEGHGGFGAGPIGFGIAGTCGAPTCAGTIGSGSRYGTISTGPHARGEVGFPGGPGVAGRPRVAAVPQVGEPVVIGAGYDKTIIRRYIRRHINELTYCYEKQLLAHPGLDVEVQTTFLIGPTGWVQSAAGVGHDDAVVRCVAAVLQTIAFPAPGGGIGVEVHYPFHFRPAS